MGRVSKVEGFGMTKEEIFNMNPVGYYSGYNGIEIKKITEEKVYCVSNCFGSDACKEVHRLKIYWDSGDPYFMLDGNRIYLKDCLGV